jgi:hypothetical protein
LSQIAHVAYFDARFGTENMGRERRVVSHRLAKIDERAAHKIRRGLTIAANSQNPAKLCLLLVDKWHRIRFA